MGIPILGMRGSFAHIKDKKTLIINKVPVQGCK